MNCTNLQNKVIQDVLRNVVSKLDDDSILDLLTGDPAHCATELENDTVLDFKLYVLKSFVKEDM